MLLLAAKPRQVTDPSVSAQPDGQQQQVRSSDPQPTQPAQPGHPQSAQGAKIDLKAINADLKQRNSSLEFKVDKTTGIPYFKIVNASTGEVVQQVPSEEVLTMARKLQELSNQNGSSGILIDKEG